MTRPMTNRMSADEVECMGRPRSGQAAVRRDPDPARAGARRRRRAASRTRSRARSSCGRRRCRTPTATALADDRRRRALHRRRPRPAAARRRQVDAGPAAPQGLRRPGRTRRGAAARQTRTRSPRSCGTARDHSIAVVPFGGGTSVVGGLDPIRGDFKAVVSLDLRRLDELHALDEVSGEAELGAGLTGPEAERLLGERGFSLGPLPAELPVRHHRRIRRDPLVRPGLGGLRPLQRHGPRPARGHPGGRARPRPRPGVRRRPGPAPAADRLGGRLRHHHPGAGAGAPGPRRPPATRRGRSPTSPPAPTRCARSSRPAPGRP